MKGTGETQGDGAIISSIFGDLIPIFIPRCLGFSGEEVGKALITWRYKLTPDLVETLDLLAMGLTYGEIAQTLNLNQEKSVSHRVQTIFEKLKVDNRTEAAVIATRYGLGTEDRRQRRGKGIVEPGE